MGNDSQRHHYVPKAYLRAFCDANDQLWAFEKDEPSKVFRTSPDNIALERYYYSQPTPDGGQDNNTIERFFSNLESEWPPIVDRWSKGDVANDKLEDVFRFIANLRTRVPAARDMVELALAESVKATARTLDRAGKLPPLPAGLENLLDDLDVSIDPHRSIHAMANLIQGLKPVFANVGLEIVHNRSTRRLITSDNPVCYFDPDVDEGALLPYTVRPPRQRIELLMPVSPDLMLRGHTDLQVGFARAGLQQRVTIDHREIQRYNRMAARFGYRFMFASDRSNEPVIRKYATKSPVPSFQSMPVDKGEFLVSQMIFGGRRPKPKWRVAAEVTS